MSESNEEIMPGVMAMGGFGPLPLEAFHDMTGLEILRAIISGDLPAPPISKTLSLALVEADEGRVVFKGLPKVDYLNPGGSVHGGWTATIMDSALACVVHSVLKKGEALATTEFKLNLLRPVREGVLRAEAEIISMSRRMAVVRIDITNGDRLAGAAQGTVSIQDPR